MPNRRHNLLTIGASSLLITASFAGVGQSQSSSAVAADAAVASISGTEPIAFYADGSKRMTRIQTLTVPGAPDVILLTVSEPKLIERIEARVGASVIGGFNANGIFDADWNRPTAATQIPLQIDAGGKELLADGGELTLWVRPSDYAANGYAEPAKSVEIGVKYVRCGEAIHKIAAGASTYSFKVMISDPESTGDLPPADAVMGKLIFDAPREPIAITSNPSVPSRATRVLTFAVPEAPESVSIDVSEPKYVSRFEARVNGKTVGYFDANGIFDFDWNRPTKPTTIPIPIDDPEPLKNGGEVNIWAVPSGLATPETTIEITPRGADFSAGSSASPIRFDVKPLKYRFGVLVRDSGWDGVAQYRIPALAQTTKGTLLAIYDARWNGFPDLPANIDVMCSRSLDGGQTWGPMKPVMDFHGENEAHEGVGDPSVLVDPATGRIWVAALWGHGNRGAWNSEPGLKMETSPRFMLCYSDDDGETWSEPRDITNEAAPGKDWRHFLQGPGMGIALRDGTLVFPAQYTDVERVWYATLIWSKDSGETWHVGSGAHKATCEAQLAELNDGSIMINMRHFTDKFRAVAVTKDLGETWTEHPTSGKALIEPACQGSLIKIRSTADGDDDNLMAFMNPASQTGRVDLTLKLSRDEGKTWPAELQRTLYTPQGLGYSALTKIDANTLGVLHETAGGLLFQRIDLNEILNGEN